MPVAELADLWHDDDVCAYLEADGYVWVDGEWHVHTDIDVVAM